MYDHHGGPKQRKWILVGGSYAGAVVAWFKNVYPDSAVAAWSSSGVIEPIIEFTNFDLDIYNMTMLSGNICTDTIVNLTKYVDDVFAAAK